MKTLLAFIAFAAVALSAAAQSYSIQSVSIPSTLAASATTNVAQVMDVRRQDNVAVQYKFAFTGSGTDSVTLTFSRSVDGLNWSTYAANKFTIAQPGNGATAVIITTNLPTLGFGYLRLDSIANAHASQDVTNQSLKYAVKALP